MSTTMSKCAECGTPSERLLDGKCEMCAPWAHLGPAPEPEPSPPLITVTLLDGRQRPLLVGGLTVKGSNPGRIEVVDGEARVYCDAFSVGNPGTVAIHVHHVRSEVTGLPEKLFQSNHGVIISGHDFELAGLERLTFAWVDHPLMVRSIR